MKKKYKIIAIIQTRMRSRRLPNKALLDLEGKPAILRMIERVKLSKLISKIYIATSVAKEDDSLANLVDKEKTISLFRGDEKNVLSRFYEISKKEGAEIVVRLTGDCPLIDPYIIDQTIELLISKKADYASNTLKRTYPDGLDVEVFTASSLYSTYKNAKDNYSLEHVTPYMHGKSKKDFKVGNYTKVSLEYIADFSCLRWTLDEERDLAVIREIFKALKPLSSWQEILAFLMKRPFIQMRNQSININEGSSHHGENISKRYKKSNLFFKRAINSVPLGSQTFSKSFIQWPRGVSPLFIERGYGSKIVDIDGNHYVDYVLGLLPITLGYCDADVDEAVIKQINKGPIFSLPSKLETILSEKLIEIIPCAEMVRFGKNGSDVTTAAIRIARAFTGKDLIAASGYHGWHDWYIGSSTRNLGVPKATKNLTKKFIFNDIESLKVLLKKYPSKFAAVIIEPAGLVPTDESFLKDVRQICNKEKILLIYDEIISGFRIDIGGAQSFFGVLPDIACFGKGMANGYPLSALVGKKEVMQLMQDIFFSTTFGGDTISIAASIATIKKMEKLKTIQKVKLHGTKLINSLNKIITKEDLSDFIEISNTDWWPQVIIKKSYIDRKLIDSLLRQEFLKFGLLIGGTLNLCYAHLESKTFNETLEKFEKAIKILKIYIDNDNPKVFLKGDYVQKTFKVR